MRGFNRISGERIDLHCSITEPVIVLVVDDTLVKKIDVCAGLGKEGICIINTPSDPSEAKAKLKMNGGRVFTVDATRISRDILGAADRLP